MDTFIQQEVGIEVTISQIEVDCKYKSTKIGDIFHILKHHGKLLNQWNFGLRVLDFEV